MLSFSLVWHKLETPLLSPDCPKRTNERQLISPNLASLHWLPAHLRIDFKIVLLNSKAKFGLAPVYISEHLMPCEQHRSLRSSGGSLLVVAKSKLRTKGDRVFSIREIEKVLQGTL